MHEQLGKAVTISKNRYNAPGHNVLGYHHYNENRKGKKASHERRAPATRQVA